MQKFKAKNRYGNIFLAKLESRNTNTSTVNMKMKNYGVNVRETACQPREKQKNNFHNFLFVSAHHQAEQQHSTYLNLRREVN